MWRLLPLPQEEAAALASCASHGPAGEAVGLGGGEEGRGKGGSEGQI